MSKKFTPELQRKFVQDEIKAWVKEDVKPAMAAAIAKRQKKIPESTSADLEHEILSGLGDALGGYNLSFRDESRYVDMRQIEFPARPILPGNNFMLEWAKRKGRKKFRKGVPGYPNGLPPNSKLTEEKILERIAAAIIVRKQQKRTYRPKGKWYNKTMWKMIGKLTSRLSRNQAEWLAKQQKETIKNAMKQ